MGCVRHGSSSRKWRHDFNPRTLVGCDPVLAVYKKDPTHISIHAPTWGATGKLSLYFIFFLFQSTHPRGVRLGSLCFYYGCFAYFNPRTHVGCDFFPQLNISVIKHFNPRTHVGCDGHITSCTLYIANFNPRTHVGCDVAITAGLSATRISIHAPTWGATRPLYFLHSVTTISIHAPTWGATFRYLVASVVSANFNPRTHVGCDC